MFTISKTYEEQSTTVIPMENLIANKKNFFKLTLRKPCQINAPFAHLSLTVLLKTRIKEIILLTALIAENLF